MTTTELRYDGKGAAGAVAAAYRSALTSTDGVDLSAPGGDGKLPTHGRQTVAVSLRFAGSTDSCDLYVIAWGRDEEGTEIALGVQLQAAVAAGIMRESATGRYIATTRFADVSGAQFFEVRVDNLSGGANIDIRAWTY